MTHDWKSEWARLFVSAAIFLYFGYALVQHWSNGIEETLKNAFMIAVGFWLGSSKGSADKTRSLAHKGTPADPIAVEIEP